MSERCLVGRVLAGDEGAIDRLIDAAWPRAALGHPNSLPAGDLRQEACQELIAAARGYDPARDGDFAALAVARMRRRLERLLRADRRRHARLRPARLDALPAPADPAALSGPGADEPEGNRRLVRALGTLPPRLRALIVRSYGRDMGDADIAAEYGLSPDAVERARRRAAALLRNELRGPRPR
ncbi:MAG TPA: sigma-70 family RNA polymerase sigma factor [Chloroflexota bacterium]